MGILNLYPLGLVFALHDANFIVGSSAFALCQYANIYFIGEDALDSLVSPLGRFSGLEDGIELDPAECLYSIGERTPIWFSLSAIRPMEKPSLYMAKITCTYSLTASSTIRWFLFSGDFLYP